MILTEFKTDTEHHFTDEHNNLQGEYKVWYKNGQLGLHCYYVNGMLHGECKKWHDNGQLSRHGHFVYNKRHGEFKLWDEHGQLAVQCHYVDYVLHGEYKWWRGDGELMEHSIYNMGEVLDIDPVTLTQEDRVMLTLKYGFQWL